MLHRLILIICLCLTSGEFNLIQAADKASDKNVISKSTAIKSAKDEVNGKVLSAKLIKSKGPAIYRVKMLVGDSRVRTVFVDGVSGKVIRIN